MTIGLVANAAGVSVDTLRFSLREIKEMVSLGVKSTAECGPVTRKAQAKLAAMNAEIRRLQRLRRTLGKMIEDCGGCICAECANLKETIDGSDHLHQHGMLRVPSGNGISHHAQRALRRKEPRDRSVRAR